MSNFIYFFPHSFSFNNFETGKYYKFKTTIILQKMDDEHKVNEDSPPKDY